MRRPARVHAHRATGFTPPPSPSAQDIIATAVATADLATLVVAVKAADLVAALSMPNGPYVVFAPTNEAFAKIPTDTLNYLLAHPDELRPIILYHAVDHRIYADEIVNFQCVQARAGSLGARGAHRQRWLHRPPPCPLPRRLSTPLQARAHRAGPRDGLHRQLDGRLCRQHGQGHCRQRRLHERVRAAVAEAASVSRAQAPPPPPPPPSHPPTHSSRSVVHLIDTVLIPAAVEERAAAWVRAGKKAAAPTQNIVQIAEATADLSTLVVAVKAAGLADTLSGPGPFTVLAPTNEAFTRLPPGVLDYLLNRACSRRRRRRRRARASPAASQMPPPLLSPPQTRPS